MITKQKIAVLGGGLGSLSAVYDLTSYPGWQERYEITLYQMGWRLGGKMRTGRGKNKRDEELGLHVLIGFEQNLFDLLRTCWVERQPSAASCPYKTLDDAIVPNNGSLFTEWVPQEYRWTNWPFIFPVGPNPYPCMGPPLTGLDYLKRIAALLVEMLFGSPYGRHFLPFVRQMMMDLFPDSPGDQIPTALNPNPNLGDDEEKGLWDRLAGGVFDDWIKVVKELAEEVKDLAEDVLAELMEELKSMVERWQASLSGEVKNWLAQLAAILADGVQFMLKLFPKLFLLDDTFRHIIQSVSLGTAALKGIALDVYNPKTHQLDFSRIENVDFRVWIKANGCADYALFSPLAQFAYQGAFAGLADGHNQGGSVSAGNILKTLMPAAGYQSSFLYQLRLGTGDTLVMPIYQTLAQRGVRFEFFSKVVEMSPDENGGIGEIVIQPQASLKKGSYQPYELVKGTPCWPAEPLYDQLDPAQAQELQAQKIDLESPWSPWPRPDSGLQPFSLKRGVDFDQVILGIPPAAQKSFMQKIVTTNPRWAQMIAGNHNQAVTGVQFWYNATLAQMGYHHQDWGMAETHCLPNVITYQNPLFSFIDQTYIVENEDWPQGQQPKTMIMFSGYQPGFDDQDDFSDHQFPEREKARLKQITWAWMMDNMGFFFKTDAPPAYPTGINMNRLAPTNPQITGPGPLYDDQWFSPIIAPSDRYNLSPPGNNVYRIAGGESGYNNLFLVGDWTNYGNNMGYMEGTVVSGYKGARALREQAFGLKDHRPYHEQPDVT